MSAPHRPYALVAAGLLALACTGSLALAAPASAYSQAAFPAQARGDHGVDTLALQHLLRQAGQSAPANGVFDQATTGAVKAFQAVRQLTADGVAGPRTWQALAVLIRPGAQGEAVRGLQELLNRKRSAKLTVNGSYDEATRKAVAAFQDHAGIGSDGVAGPLTWQNLTWHYVVPRWSSGICDQNPDGNTGANWMTASAAAHLEAAATSWAGRRQGRIPMGDGNFEHGEPIGGHVSHRLGFDVDLWPIRRDKRQCAGGRITWRSAGYDQAATRELVRTLRATAPGRVKLVFFNDPQLIREGLTVKYPNHDNHLHVRYCAPVHASSLYTC